jgi:hypothetical protein
VTGRIVILNGALGHPPPASRRIERIWHLLEHDKALEEGKWAKVTGWGDKAEAQRILMEAIDRYAADKDAAETPAEQAAATA